MRYTPTGNPRVHGMIYHTTTTSQIGSQIGCPEGSPEGPNLVLDLLSSKPAVEHAKPLLQSVERSKWGLKWTLLETLLRGMGPTMRWYEIYLRVIHVYMVYHLSCGPPPVSGPPSGEGPKGCFQPDEMTTLRPSLSWRAQNRPKGSKRGLQEVPLRGYENPNEVPHLLKGVYLGIVSHTTSHMSPS